MPVPTPVWVARDGDALVVTTPAASGKVKRLRSNPQVELVPCSRRGRVRDGASPVAGTAEIVGDEEHARRLTDSLRRKYGVEFRLVYGGGAPVPVAAGSPRGPAHHARLSRSGVQARVALPMREVLLLGLRFGL